MSRAGLFQMDAVVLMKIASLVLVPSSLFPSLVGEMRHG